ncbi:right-handed parallel beta-helix repeat-containing protein [Streptomyces sp. NPDC002004]
MAKRQILYLGCVTLIAASGLGCAPAEGATAGHTVVPGESIQKAVDAAKSGDTISIAPGTYQESVLITKSGLTIRGSGRGTTIIKPSATKEAATNACAKAGNGLCVQGTSGHPVVGTTIRALTLSGYSKNALWATGTDQLTVRDVAAEKNGNWGFATEKSTRSVFRDNLAQNNAESGLFLSNTVGEEGGATDALDTLVRSNVLKNNRVGLTVRRLRNLSVDQNDVSGNCNGIFVVGDEGKPRAGHLSIRSNTVHANNKYCPKTARLPYIQGSGIVLTGTEDNLVEKNTIRDNVGKSQFSGGVVLFKSFVGTPNDRNVVRDNTVTGNTTADLANRGPGTGNKFDRNVCRVSEPAGMC